MGQSSKLDNFEKQHRDAMNNVQIAIQQQKETKGSFNVIKEQFIECKRQFDILSNMQQQQNKVYEWKKCEKWMIYEKEFKKLLNYQNEINLIKNKIKKGQKQMNEKKEKICDDMKILKNLKNEIEKNGKEQIEK